MNSDAKLYLASINMDDVSSYAKHLAQMDPWQRLRYSDTTLQAISLSMIKLRRDTDCMKRVNYAEL